MGETGYHSLPSRALLVGGTVEAAAVLAPDFDELRIVIPAELTHDVLEGDGRPFTCVGITGVPAVDGALASVIQATLESGPQDVRVLLDLTDEAAAGLVDGVPLRGLHLVGATTVSGVAVALFERSADPAEVPDLEPIAAAGRADRRKPFPDAEPYRALAEARILRGRMADLERRLEVTTDALVRSRQSLAKARERARRDARLLKRLRSTTLGRLALLSERTARRGRSALARRPGLLLAVAVAGVALIAAVDVLVGVLADVPGWAYWEIAAAELALLALAYLVRGQRRGHQRLAQAVRLLEAEPASRAAQHRELKQADARLALAVKNLQAQSTRMTDLAVQVHANSVDHGRALAQLRQVVRDQASAPVGAPSQLTTTHQTQALINLFGILPVERPVPLMGGWAASPDVMVLLLTELLEGRPRLVVECGSGVSTLWFALAIRHYGLDCRVVALEHDERFAAVTRASLMAHGVAQHADVRHAALVDTGIAGHDTPWYDASALADLEDIGLLFVDGPPEATGPDVRYPAVPMLKDRFAARVTVVLDDLVRESEQAAARAWKAQLPDFEFERVTLDKGAAVFRRVVSA